MATINYRIKGTSEQTSIKVRFKQGNEFDYELSTGLKILRKHWSLAKQRVKLMAGSFDYADNINLHLERLKTLILERFYIDQSMGLI